MTSRSLIRPFSLFISAFLTVAVAGAQSDTASAQQKPSLKFAPAAVYDSGGPVATSVAVADLRHNGKLDIVVANYCQTLDQYGVCYGIGEVAVLLGNGDGTFQPTVTYSTAAYNTNSVAVGDVNGDGIPDLVVANWCGTPNQNGCWYQSGAVSVLLGNGDGTFQPAVTYNSGGLDSYSVALGDLTGNGELDIVVTNTYYGEGNLYNGSVGVLLGNGDGPSSRLSATIQVAILRHRLQSGTSTGMESLIWSR